jgi:hypothetical protein
MERGEKEEEEAGRNENKSGGGSSKRTRRGVARPEGHRAVHRGREQERLALLGALLDRRRPGRGRHPVFVAGEHRLERGGELGAGGAEAHARAGHEARERCERAGAAAGAAADGREAPQPYRAVLRG